MGKRGVYTDSKGLKIAYISGLGGKESSDWQYSSKDVEELYNACVRGNAAFRGVDILLTSQWPENVMNNDSKKVSSAKNIFFIINYIHLPVKLVALSFENVDICQLLSFFKLNF